jgi:large subunit ribosomal protein L29
MKQEVIRELSTEELQERLDVEKFQLNKLKLHHAVSPIENPQKIKESRKVIARIMTELRKRELSAALNNANEAKKA